MTALARDRKTDQGGAADEVIPKLLNFKLAAAAIIYAGGMVATNASGLAVPVSASTALKVWGRAEKQADNAAGDAAAIGVDVKPGYFWLNTPSSGADQLARADVGNTCYASDDNTATKTAGAGLRPVLGTMVGTSADYGLPAGQVLVAVGIPCGANPYSDPASAAETLQVRARNIAAAGNVADLGVFTVAGNDGVTNVEGDVIILAEQTTAAQNGPYVVGVVGGGTAPLTRPDWWGTGAVLPSGIEIEIGAEGTVFKNTTWRAMVVAETFVVGTTDPRLYPKSVSGTTALVAGTFTISTVPVFSEKTAIHLNRDVANTSTSTTGGYHPTAGGANGITIGVRGTAAVVVEATVAAGTINAADVSTLHWTILNQAA